jgi:hypothetical protein
MQIPHAEREDYDVGLPNQLAAFRMHSMTILTWISRLGEQIAPAQSLLAQTGTTKTAIGWLIVLLCIGLGLLVMARPGRKAPDWKQK